MKNTILKIKDLDLFYAKKQAVFNVNLEVKENEVLAFIGPSGCGKSTVLRTLNRMNDLVDIFSSKGEIIYDERNILNKDEDVTQLRKEIGIILQKPTPFSMSIFENVACGLRLMGEKDEKVIEEKVINALKDAALYDEVKDKLDDLGTKLSGGQQQRLCIARTIIMEPKILLMDEPTSALDPISTIQVEELIRKLRDNFTVIIVTHNMQQARRISDKTAFFFNGELIEHGLTKDIFINPKKEKTQDYIIGKVG